MEKLWTAKKRNPRIPIGLIVRVLFLTWAQVTVEQWWGHLTGKIRTLITTWIMGHNGGVMTSFLFQNGKLGGRGRFLLGSEADGAHSVSSTSKRLETREQELVNRNGRDIKEDEKSEGQVQCTKWVSCKKTHLFIYLYFWTKIVRTAFLAQFEEALGSEDLISCPRFTLYSAFFTLNFIKGAWEWEFGYLHLVITTY